MNKFLMTIAALTIAASAPANSYAEAPHLKSLDPKQIDNITMRCIEQLAGCTILGIGIAFEIRCGSVTMPGEGMPVALTRVTSMPFAKAKILIDILLVAIAVASGYLFFGHWLWNVVGIGTLFAMIYVGYIVKLLSPHLAWFDRLVCYRPGFRRYIYGLARFIYRR